MIGSVFEDRYTLNGFLAEGPIFSLFSARDRLTAKDVSLRLIKPPFDSEAAFKDVLGTSIEATSLIHSPFVERLIGLGVDGGKSYIIGELTRAPSLADRIRKLAPFTPPVAVACGISILRGLDAYHKLNIVHGDVSGENVAMLGDGEVRLQLGGVWAAYSASKTAGILVLPTLAPYLAPEVSNGEMPSASSDLYAVGILLYELLTGRRPYQADTGLATALRHTTEPVPRVRALNPSIPMVLDEVVYKAMSKDAVSRYPNTGEFIFDLRQTQDALRFGRNLSWPIESSQAKPQVASATAASVAVAPKMGAVRDLEKPRERQRKGKTERDVPVWMLLLFFSAASAVAALVGLNFVIAATSPKLRLVPNLAGLTLAEAKENVQQLHLKVKIGGTIPSNHFDADRIIDSVPPYGQRVAENSTIAVNLSLGSKEVAVPQLKTMTPDKAKEVLSTLNLQLDPDIDRLNDPSVPEGTICKQTPATGVKLQRMGKVHVAVNKHSTPADSTPKQYMYDIKITLQDISKTVDVSIKMKDDSGTKKIFDEQKDPGDTIQTTAEGKSDQEVFTIYYDGAEVEKDTYFQGKFVKRDLKGSDN